MHRQALWMKVDSQLMQRDNCAGEAKRGLSKASEFLAEERFELETSDTLGSE